MNKTGQRSLAGSFFCRTLACALAHWTSGRRISHMHACACRSGCTKHVCGSVCARMYLCACTRKNFILRRKSQPRTNCSRGREMSLQREGFAAQHRIPHISVSEREAIRCGLPESRGGEKQTKLALLYPMMPKQRQINSQKHVQEKKKEKKSLNSDVLPPRCTPTNYMCSNQGFIQSVDS